LARSVRSKRWQIALPCCLLLSISAAIGGTMPYG
jgi:hypothetical protein